MKQHITSHMKQHITKEQWDELSEGQKKRWMDFIERDIPHEPDTVIMRGTFVHTINIGQMIEFLGDDWLSRLYWGDEFSKQKDPYDGQVVQLFPLPEDVCDNFWIACKEKLKSV